MSENEISEHAREAARQVVIGNSTIETAAKIIQRVAVAPVEAERDQYHYELQDYMAALDREETRTKGARQLADRLAEALREIGECERAQRAGGPALEDLEGLDNAVTEVVNRVCKALTLYDASKKDK